MLGILIFLFFAAVLSIWFMLVNCITSIFPTPITQGPWEKDIGDVSRLVHYDSANLVDDVVKNLFFMIIIGILMVIGAQMICAGQTPLVLFFFTIMFIGLTITLAITLYRLYNPIPYLVIGSKGIFLRTYNRTLVWSDIAAINFAIKSRKTGKSSRTTYHEITLTLNLKKPAFVNQELILSASDSTLTHSMLSIFSEMVRTHPTAKNNYKGSDIFDYYASNNFFSKFLND